MDFNFVTPRLAVGGSHGQVSEMDALALANAGVTHAINLRSHVEPYLRMPKKIAVLENGVVDDKEQKPNDWFLRSLQFGLLCLSRPRTKLYLNCFLGHDRSPSTALAILMAQGFEEEKAKKLITRARPGATVCYAADAIRAVKELGYV